MTTLIYITLAIIISAIVIQKPYMGIVFMFCTLPLTTFTIISGLSDFTSITGILGAISFFAFLFQSKTKRYASYEKKIELWSVLYLLVGALIFVVVIEDLLKPISTGFRYPFSYLQIFILLWLTPRLFKTNQEIETLMKYFIGANVTAVIFSFIGFSIDEGERLSGLQGNANEFAVYLSVAMVMVIYFTMKYHRNFLGFMLVGLMAISIILSGSRGAILFLIPVIFLQFWLLRKNKYLLIVFVLSSVIILLSLALPILPNSYIERITEIPQNILLGDDTVGLRYKLWEEAWKLWQENPILGIGTGLFQEYSKFFPFMRHPNGLVIHNTYLTYLTENGLIGFTLFLLITLKAIISYWQFIQTNKESPRKSLAIAWFAIYFIFLLNAIKGNWNLNKLLWFCIGLSIMFVGCKKKDDNYELNPSVSKSPNTELKDVFSYEKF